MCYYRVSDLYSGNLIISNVFVFSMTIRFLFSSPVNVNLCKDEIRTGMYFLHVGHRVLGADCYLPVSSPDGGSGHQSKGTAERQAWGRAAATESGLAWSSSSPTRRSFQ